MALNEVRRDELQSVVAQLKETLSSHQQWRGTLTRAGAQADGLQTRPQPGVGR